MPEFTVQRGDLLVGDAAGHDQLVGVQVGVHVEGETMHGAPAPQAHADRPDLAVPDPCTVETSDALSRQAVGCGAPNHHLLEVFDVSADISPVGVEIEDRVADDLARPVVGDVPSAPGLEQFHALGL